MSDELAVPGALVPDAPIMRKQTYSSPMSFVGITRRGTAWMRKVGTNPWKAALAVVALLVFPPTMYGVILFWYVIVFGVFGLFTIPFRFIRRGQRKSEAVQRQQLATMQAMMVQQQALQQNSEPK
jgi:hypothetical protein